MVLNWPTDESVDHKIFMFFTVLLTGSIPRRETAFLLLSIHRRCGELVRRWQGGIGEG